MVKMQVSKTWDDGSIPSTPAMTVSFLVCKLNAPYQLLLDGKHYYQWGQPITRNRYLYGNFVFDITQKMSGFSVEPIRQVTLINKEFKMEICSREDSEIRTVYHAHFWSGFEILKAK